MSIRRRGRRVGVAAAAVAVALAVSACGGGGGGKGGGSKTAADGDGASSETTLSDAQQRASGVDKHGTPTTAASNGSGPGGTGPGGGGTTPTTDRPRRPGVPVPGRYVYSTGPGERDVKALDLHEDAGQTGADFVQLETWVDGGTIVRSVVIWQPDRKVATYEQRATPNEAGDLNPGPLCEWEPRLLEHQLPFTVGASWTSKASCPYDNGRREREVSAKVTSTDTVDVEGQKVPVVVLERLVVDTLPTPIGPSVTRTTTTEFISPGLGLLIRMTGSEERLVAGKSSVRQLRMDIRSTRPSPPPSPPKG